MQRQSFPGPSWATRPDPLVQDAVVRSCASVTSGGTAPGSAARTGGRTTSRATAAACRRRSRSPWPRSPRPPPRPKAPTQRSSGRIAEVIARRTEPSFARLVKSRRMKSTYASAVAVAAHARLTAMPAMQRAELRRAGEQAVPGEEREAGQRHADSGRHRQHLGRQLHSQPAEGWQQQADRGPPEDDGGEQPDRGEGQDRGEHAEPGEQELSGGVSRRQRVAVEAGQRPAADHQPADDAGDRQPGHASSGGR